MVTVIAVIEASKFDQANYNPIIMDSFSEIIQNNTPYLKVHTFEHYTTNAPFDYIFTTNEAYETWLQQGINKTIAKVEYDWTINKALITIADTNFPGPHEFDCLHTWTDEDCQAAINSKFPD